LIRQVGSLWFAAVLLALLLVAMACATVAESARGTDYARIEFYHSPWFAWLGALLAINVAAAVLSRYPLKRLQYGFVLTHLGILLTLSGVLVTKTWGLEGQIALAEGQATDQIRTSRSTLSLVNDADGSRSTIELGDRAFEGLAAVWSPPAPVLTLRGLQAEIQRFLPDGRWSKETVDDNPVPSPAVEVSLSVTGHEQPTLVFADPPVSPAPQQISFRIAADEADLQRLLESLGESRHTPIEIIAGRSGPLFVRFNPADAERIVQRVEPGQILETPWPDLRFSVLRRFERARVEWHMLPADPARKTRIPAILVRLTSEKHTNDMWVQKYQPRQVTIDGTPHLLVYEDRSVPMGFSLRLDGFQIRHYPGTDQPRSFESHITILDQRAGGALGRVIGMNHPTKHAGYSFYQASYDTAGGQTLSVLNVSRDPGVTLVFAGYIVTMLGLLWVFGQRAKVKHMRLRGPGVGVEIEGGAARPSVSR